MDDSPSGAGVLLDDKGAEGVSEVLDKESSRERLTMGRACEGYILVWRISFPILSTFVHLGRRIW